MEIVLGYFILVCLDLSIRVVKGAGCCENLCLEGFDSFFDSADIIADRVVLGEKGVDLGLSYSLIFNSLVEKLGCVWDIGLDRD